MLRDLNKGLHDFGVRNRTLAGIKLFCATNNSFISVKFNKKTSRINKHKKSNCERKTDISPPFINHKQNDVV